MNLADDKTALEFTASNNSTSNNSSWLELVRAANHNKALEELDTILNTNNYSVLERLWWIRCQLNLNLLPISTLTSPLEEIYPQLLESKDNSGLAISTFYKIANFLLEKNQSRLSLLMAERALALNNKHKSISEEHYIELKELNLKTLDAELKNAQEKKESVQYIKNLEEKIESLKKANNKKLTPEWTLEPQTQSSNKPENTKKSSNKLIYFAVLLILILASFLILNKENNSGTQLALSLPLPETRPHDPKFTFNSNPSVLTGVEKRLATLGSSSSTSSSSSEQAVDKEALEKASKIELPQEDEVESINKDLKTEEEQIPETKIPRLDPNKVGAASVDTVEQSPRRAGVSPSLPEIINNEPRIPEGKTLDGKVLQSYDVEVFDPPLVYNTITPTEVLSAPSLLSKSLARLENGTHIYVSKKMGLWLEIQSTGGRIGYIYAQDAQLK